MDLDSSSCLVVLGCQEAWTSSPVLGTSGAGPCLEDIADYLQSCYNGPDSGWYAKIVFINFFDDDILKKNDKDYEFDETCADIIVDLMEEDYACSFSASLLTTNFADDVFLESLEEEYDFIEWFSQSQYLNAYICGINIDLHGKRLGARFLELGISPSILTKYCTWQDNSMLVDTLSFFAEYADLERC